MSDKTKACNLTYDEIDALLEWHGRGMCGTVVDNKEETVERMKYLIGRRKTFNEGAPELKSEPNAAGWTSNNG